MGTYSLGDAARILKVSPERLRYWERRELLRLRDDIDARPVLQFRDLVTIRAIVGLLDKGVPLRSIRRSVETLRKRMPEIEDPVASLRLWAEGSPRVVVDHAGALLEPDGQMVLDFRSAPSAVRPMAPIGRVKRVPSEARYSALDWFEQGCSLDSEVATHKQAADAYRRALELDPEFPDAYCNLGAVLYHQGERSAARRCFERCLELVPQHVEGHFNLANVLEEDGSNDAAIFHYRAVLKSDPLYADAHLQLALLCEKLDREPAALEHWRHYLQLEPNGAWAAVARERLARRT